MRWSSRLSQGAPFRVMNPAIPHIASDRTLRGTAPCHKPSESDCPRYGSISNRKHVYKLPHVMQANRARPMTFVPSATITHEESHFTGVNENNAQRHDDADSIDASGCPEFGKRRWTLPYLTDISLIPSTTCCIGAKSKSVSSRCKRSSVLCKLT